MNKPKLVGVTGGIGSGKSTVCKIFEILGSKVYYADDRAKYLMEEDEKLKSQIETIFGTRAYQNRKLDRKEIARLVFEDRQLLERLNHVVHPAVRRDFEKWVELNTNEKVLLKEAALLIEAGSYKDLDKLILITAKVEDRIERVLKRDAHRNRQDVEKIVAEQLSDAEKIPFADFVIENDNNKSVIQQTNEIYNQLIIA